MEPNREELLRKLRQIREEIKNVNVLQKQAYAVIEKKRVIRQNFRRTGSAILPIPCIIRRWWRALPYPYWPP